MEQPNQPNDDDQDDYCNPDMFGWLGGARLSDEAIAEIKEWTKSKPSTEYNEEIWRVLQNDVNYYDSQIGDILEILSFEDEDKYEVRNSKIVIPERVKKLLIEKDELERAYNLAKIKVIAYEYGVTLSDDDAKKILISEAGIHLLLECDNEKSISEFYSSSDRNNPVARKKFDAQLDKNKKEWKSALLPYVAPMTQAQTVVATASRTPKKPARRATRSSVKSGDGNSDPEPKPPRQLYFTYQSFAQLVDCTTRTLYNKVSTGQFPRPVKTAFGPRFTQQHLDSIIKATPTPQTKRGRPRIADSIQGGVQ